jgi:hypothetical protein
MFIISLHQAASQHGIRFSERQNSRIIYESLVRFRFAVVHLFEKENQTGQRHTRIAFCLVFTDQRHQQFTHGYHRNACMTSRDQRWRRWHIVLVQESPTHDGRRAGAVDVRAERRRRPRRRVGGHHTIDSFIVNFFFGVRDSFSYRVTCAVCV